MAEPLIEGTDYIKCELTEAADREMIVTLEDFLRRRSKLALVVQNEDLKKSDGLKEACKILFAEDAANRWEEYFGEQFWKGKNVPSRYLYFKVNKVNDVPYFVNSRIKKVEWDKK